jgi:hypothetical protein
MAEFRGNLQARVRGGSVAWQAPQASVLLRNSVFDAGAVGGITLSGGVFSAGSVAAGAARLVLNAGQFYFRSPSGGDLTVSQSGGTFAAS